MPKMLPRTGGVVCLVHVGACPVHFGGLTLWHT